MSKEEGKVNQWYWRSDVRWFQYYDRRTGGKIHFLYRPFRRGTNRKKASVYCYGILDNVEKECYTVEEVFAILNLPDYESFKEAFSKVVIKNI